MTHRPPHRPLRSVLMAAIPLAACSSAPTQNIAGSFFPSWLLCAGIGALAAAALRAVLGLFGVEGAVLAPIVTYCGAGLAVTLAVWLIWFGH